MPHNATANINIKLGADPEFEWFRGSNFISASSVTGSTSTQLGTDGASSTGEIRPSPGNPMQVWHSIGKLLGQASQFGLDMYAGSGRVHPTGGHIHFSGIEHTPALLQKLDKFVTIPLNEVSDRSHRRMYGALSEVRQQPHGWEYRSPCSWIVHPKIAMGVLRIAWVLANAQAMNRLNEINTVNELKAFCNNLENPFATRKDIEHFQVMLKRMKKHNIKLEQVEVFQAWKKKDRVSGQTSTTPRNVVSNTHWAFEDYNMEAVQSNFVSILRNTHSEVEGETAHIYGASLTRTEDLVVFVPENIALPERRSWIDDVQYRHWTNSYYGISYNLRANPLKAARAMYNALKHEVAPIVSNNAQVIDIIEGRRNTTCAA